METMAMPFNISWSISWGKKMGWEFSFNFPNWDIARGFWQFIDDQFSLNLNILSISLETRHIHFFLCIVYPVLLPTSSNIFRWLYPQVVPATQETWPRNGPSQALIVIRTCTDGTFANDVALGCAGFFVMALAVHGENFRKTVVEHVGTAGICWDDWSIIKCGNDPVFRQTHAKWGWKMMFSLDMVISFILACLE